jgi:hypothetical protein
VRFGCRQGATRSKQQRCRDRRDKKDAREDVREERSAE